MALSIFNKLARGLTRTRESIAATLSGLGRTGAVDEEAIEALEAGLLAADLGPELTAEVIDVVRERATDNAGGVVDAVRATHVSKDVDLWQPTLANILKNKFLKRPEKEWLQAKL